MYELKIVRERRSGYTHRQRFRSSADIYENFKEHFARLDREHFVVVLLDAKNVMLGFHTVSIGSLTSSLVHPREVYKSVVLYNDGTADHAQEVIKEIYTHSIRASAAALILMHNHPSGDPAPSQEDLHITRRLRDVGDLLGIRVLDHLVFARGAMSHSLMTAIGRYEGEAMRTLIVNCSAPHYNLGAQKLAHWLRSQDHEVALSDGDPGLFAYGYDRVCLSVIFSWHAPVARSIALRVKRNAEVWCGGPGMFTLGQWWERATGLACARGLDQRFERERGTYWMTFASRGCPVGCSFCIVPQLEGRSFTLDWDFSPAPVLCDNNLGALPVAFQEHIIRRYCEVGVPLRDANSGFEPQTFDETCYQRWKPILQGPWRCAYDTLSEGVVVERMLRILAAELPSRKRVYVLIGNEPIAACYERACKVIEWQGEPFCQPFIPLNALSRHHLKIAHDWTQSLLKDFARYFNRYLWRTISLRDYTNRKREPPPFASLIPTDHETINTETSSQPPPPAVQEAVHI